MKTHVKSILLGIVFTLCACAFVTSESVYAKKTYTENDITYRIMNEEAIVTSCSVAGNVVTVTEVVNGYNVTSIGRRAFAGSKYSEIVLPETVVTISNDAFYACENLTSVRLPSKLSSLGARAFCECVKLKEVNLGSSLREIQSSAFNHCINLKKITLPSKLTVIGESAFRDCFKLTGVKLGKNVRSIDENAFARNYRLTGITIPSKVKTVGMGAFFKCKRLKKVVFENDNTELDKYVFDGCEALKKISLPKNMKDIPEGLFNRSGLRKIKLPAKVSIMKARAFAGCKDLNKITLNKVIYAIGDRAFENSGLTTLKLNSNMKYIGNGAFRGTNVKNVSLPQKVAYIGNRVFANCENLSTIKIPASVKGINPGAFNNCVSLKSIDVASGNKDYSSQDGVLYNKDKSKLIQYPLNKKNAGFTVPRSVDTIRSHAFEENSNLKSVTLSAKTIGDYAFASMSNLTTVVLQSGVKTIGESAFDYDNSLTTVTIADSVKKIGDRAFRGSAVKSVHIPSSLESLNSNAFEDCNKIAEFTGGRGKKFRVESGVLYDAGMKKLIMYPAKKQGSTFAVPTSVKSLGPDAFSHVSALKELSFGKSIKSMPYSCIRNCPNLQSVTFDDGTSPHSGYHAISDCNRLAVIVAPDKSTFRSMANYARATLITL